MNRRDLLVASAAVTGAVLTARLQRRKYTRDFRPPSSRIVVLPADQYSNKLDQLVYEGIRLFNLNVRGKSVLLKPNLVEYIPGRPVNTDTQLIGAAAETFLRLGAASVTVAEGPGIIATRSCSCIRRVLGIISRIAISGSSISIATNSSRRNSRQTTPAWATYGSLEPFCVRISLCPCRR